MGSGDLISLQSLHKGKTDINTHGLCEGGEEESLYTSVQLEPRLWF